MSILNDIINILKSLSILDYVLYFSVVILIILVVSLISIIKSETENTPEIEIESDGEIDLKEIAHKIDTHPKPIIDMTKYETEQEEKAIISYEELLENTQNLSLNYLDEEMVDEEVSVKLIDLNSLTKREPITDEYPPKVDVRLMKYEHEEAFLKALNQLNELLNL